MSNKIITTAVQHVPVAPAAKYLFQCEAYHYAWFFRYCDDERLIKITTPKSKSWLLSWVSDDSHICSAADYLKLAQEYREWADAESPQDGPMYIDQMTEQLLRWELFKPGSTADVDIILSAEE